MTDPSWISNRYGDASLSLPEGDFWIGNAGDSRSGMYEVEFTTAAGRIHLGRTRSFEAAKALVRKKLRQLRKKVVPLPRAHRAKGKHATAVYRACACRDAGCMESARGGIGVRCSACKAAGCLGDGGECYVRG